MVIFFYDKGSRGRDVFTDFIGDAELKSIMSDGYNAYTFIGNIFTYIKDGSCPIDNNAAERVVRPLTTQRNGMLHFGSDEGAKIAATYHSIISTVKLQGRSAWDYLGKFFVNIFNGCRDFFSLRPDKIGLAICQLLINK